MGKKKKAKDKGGKPLKQEVKAKVKEKLKKKGLASGAGALLLVSMVLFAGCQTADPSSRSNRADVGGVQVTVNGNHNTTYVDIGDLLTADASGGGDTQSNTPTLSTDVTTKAAAAWGASSAANEGSPGQSGDFISSVGKLIRIFNGSGETLDANEAAAVRECVDGACGE